MADGEALAYLAGFFDGEGSIHLGAGLQVNAAQVDRRPLDMLQAAFGGSVRPAQDRGANRPVSYWCVYGASAGAFLTAIYPLLIVKAEQAALGIAYQQTYGPLGSRSVPPEKLRARALIKEAMHVSRSC